MLNQVNIQCNLTKDPDYREFPNGGGSVCTMRVASSRKFKNASGQMQEETTFVKVKTFGKLASTCRQFLSKGSSVIFTGHLALDHWEKDGVQKQEIYINAEKIEFLPSRSEQRENPPRPPHGGEHYQHHHNNNNNYSAPPSDRATYAPPSQHDIDKGNGYQPQPEPPQDDDIPF